MLPRQINVSLAFDAFSVDLSVPTAGFVSWFGGLQDRNDASRARDRGEGAEAHQVYRNHCPECFAPATSLTAFDTDEGRIRACMPCGAQFSCGDE